MSSSTEIWKTIDGYDGFYEVSNRGRVRSYKGANQFSKRRKKPKILKPRITNNTGHRQVSLCRNGNVNQICIHKLVALYFIGNPPSDKHIVCHKKDDPSKNGVDDIYWGLPKDNYHDSVKNSRRKEPKLNKEKVELIHELSDNKTQAEISKQIGVDQSTISLVINNKIWSHIDV